MIKEQFVRAYRKNIILFIGCIIMISFYPLSSLAEVGINEKEENEASTELTEEAQSNEENDSNAEMGNSEEMVSEEEDFDQIEWLPSTAKKQVAENEKWEMYIDEGSGNIRVVNKDSNYEWFGGPRKSKKTLPNNIAYMDSPVYISYTEGSSITNTYTLKESSTTMDITMIEDGARVDFGLEDIDIFFSVEYKLTVDGFEASIPDDSVREEGVIRLISLELLPFFGAAYEGLDEGAVFLPDGSGGLMQVRKEHPQYFSGYSEPVYGPDQAFNEDSGEVLASGLIIADAPKEKVALPVYGIYQADKGFLAIITEGEETANINATPAGIRNINMYRAGAEFFYRNQDTVFIGSSGGIPLFQGERNKADRTIKYVLLEDEEADYVGMAKAYRNHLIEEDVLQKQEEDQIRPLSITLVGGIMRDEIVGSTFIDMTTFEQVKEIIGTYVDQGIDSLKITLKGWSQKGIYGNQPKHFPVERKLGGKKKLTDLVQYAESVGIDLYLNTNYIRPYAKSKGVSASKDAIRGIDREIMENSNYHVSSRVSNSDEIFYLMNPDKAIENAKGEIKKYQDIGITGIHLDHIGELLYSDQDRNKLTSRKDTKEVWTNLLDQFADSIGKVSVDYGFAYVLGHVDGIQKIPMDSSHFVNLDETVPFYQMVIHGYIPYTGKPSNLRNDERVDLLRAIEYGASPNFELTYKSTDHLKRTMEDRLFSSSFHFWFDRSMEEYDRFLQVTQETAGQIMIGHEELARNVYKTTYENGTEVIVNYNRKAKEIDGVLIEGLDYLVQKGRRSES
ncbi:DUF5696 domain-containing protein [Bacillus sp. SD088]|uniref:DUF5696 domain-containing protein n=1 Tax=Bacillus sp. SD088 TaxID=2782012 RepID=UPI001A960BC1|nr:DUF5696 domain-containing protein [Bacillus sp. SD088]MBO0991683.1 hypothetical protein [Bacillus sp. SD088]